MRAMRLNELAMQFCLEIIKNSEPQRSLLPVCFDKSKNNKGIIIIKGICGPVLCSY